MVAGGSIERAFKYSGGNAVDDEQVLREGIFLLPVAFLLLEAVDTVDENRNGNGSLGR